jgi:hypothetical protein
MLHSFLTTNRALLIARCRALAAERVPSDGDEFKIGRGIAIFLDQVIETLIIEQNADSGASRSLSGIAGGRRSSEIAETAAAHSRELLKSGLSLEQVVREYGDVCQAVTNLAVETRAPIATEGLLRHC